MQKRSKTFTRFVFLPAIFLMTTGVVITVQAQDTWSLERCIQYAKDNNITVKQAQANVRTAMLSEKQAKASRLPNVSANANVGEQFGRTIDPTTNQFSTVATSFNSLGLNAGVNLFSGGLINYIVVQMCRTSIGKWLSREPCRPSGRGTKSLTVCSTLLN